MKIEIYNQKGEIIEEMPLREEIFRDKFNPDFLHQVFKTLWANRYPVIAFTKTRKEVKGGGKKPWRQKGTGRARHGSIRSPLWRGGGVVFGPRRKEENLKKKVNKKVKQKALRMAIAKKIIDKEVKIVDSLETQEIKTKIFDKIFKNIIKLEKKKKMPSSLIILDPQIEKNIKQGVKNLPYLGIVTLDNLDLIEILNHKYLLFSKNTFRKLEEKLVKANQ
ncbi:MAG: 50S ribosomal protein L4 [Minisyncoccia bacterium]